MYLPSCKILWKSMHIFIGKFGLKNKKSPKKYSFLCFFTCNQCLNIVKPQFFYILVNITCLGCLKIFLTNYLKKWVSYDCSKTHGRKENMRKWPIITIFGYFWPKFFTYQGLNFLKFCEGIVFDVRDKKKES